NIGELLKWRCTKNDCTATIYSGPEKNIVLQSNGQHNHEGNSLNKIQRQVLRENCKRRAEESISMQPLKLIRHELIHNTELTSIVHNDLKTVRKAMYDRRRKTLPEIPMSREDIFLQLNSIKTQTHSKLLNSILIPTTISIDGGSILLNHISKLIRKKYETITNKLDYETFNAIPSTSTIDMTIKIKILLISNRYLFTISAELIEIILGGKKPCGTL
ncbi:Uncharacterized protein FWK35_00001806, partial [Aphis craccivora]